MPDVLRLRNPAIRREIRRLEVPELLAEMRIHLRDPLCDQPTGRDHQSAVHQAAQFQFPENESGLDSLAQPDLIREQEADAVPRNRLPQRSDLVWQGNDRSVDGREKHVFREQVRQPRRHQKIAQARCGRRCIVPVPCRLHEVAFRHKHDGVTIGEPDSDGRRIPEIKAFNDMGGRLMCL